MPFNAKYPGVCLHCGGRIHPGQVIDKAFGTGYRHFTCPAPVVAAPAPDTIYTLYGTGRSKAAAHAVGRVFRSTTHGVVIIVSVSYRFIAEDGLSFGLSDDKGWKFRYACRPATEEEAAPLLAEEQRKEALAKALARLDAVKLHIQMTGECPDGVQEPTGEFLPASTDRRHVVIDGFVLGDQHVWYCRHASEHGANRINLYAGGQGATGWRIPYDSQTADEIRTIIQGGTHHV